MANFIFGIAALIVLNVLIASCKGKLSPPLDGDNLVFVNGSTAKIQWSVSDGLSEEQFRYWAFSSGDGSQNAVELARIVDDGVVVNQKSPLDFEIEKPATLVLKNVSQNYNGEFRFILVTSEDCGQSDVLVRIAVLPTVTVSCSSQVIAKEGDNITCVCTEQGSNPPATLTWYKDGKQITDQQKERQTLSLSNIERDDNGTYRCEAKHLVSDEEESIEIIVQYKPTNTTITIEPATVSVGGTVTITCESYAHPEPVFTIEKNGTNVVFTSKEHTIRDVNKRDAATYRCVAENKHGIDSKSASLALADRQIQSAAEDKVRMVYIITPSVIGFLFVAICCIIYYLRRSGRCIRGKKKDKDDRQRGQPGVGEYEVPQAPLNEDYELVERNEPEPRNERETRNEPEPGPEIPAAPDPAYASLSRRRDPDNPYESLLARNEGRS